ncbi:MAG TPA: sulfur carrier protein ThiS [Arenibaculum sp.]|nr:sulfur carrier protein ThiS [Arenibaculum sp.]
MTQNIRINGEPEPLDAATLADLLTARGIVPPGGVPRGVAVAVNGMVVPAARWADHRLGPGDEIEIVRPFQGG